jgi:Flp pilus assembly protein TadG
MERMTRLRDETGAVAVEFAIVLPLLIVMVFGIIEFSILLFDKAVITNASREGARRGIVFSDPRPSDGDIIAVVQNYTADHLITFGSATGVGTTITRPVDAASGDPLTVNVSYRYEFLILPNFITSLTGGIDLAAETVMRME